MITCDRFENCKRIGVIPKRVQWGYGPCRNQGKISQGKRKGEPCTFVTFPEVDLEKANQDIMAGKSYAHSLAIERRAQNR